MQFNRRNGFQMPRGQCESESEIRVFNDGIVFVATLSR